MVSLARKLVAAGGCGGDVFFAIWNAMIRKSCKTYAGRDPEKGKIMASTEGFLPAVQVPHQTPPSADICWHHPMRISSLRNERLHM